MQDARTYWQPWELRGKLAGFWRPAAGIDGTAVVVGPSANSFWAPIELAPARCTQVSPLSRVTPAHGIRKPGTFKQKARAEAQRRRRKVSRHGR